MQRALDVVLGHIEMTIYNKRELATMLTIQQEQTQHRSLDEEEGHVHQEEVSIIAGALKFRDLTYDNNNNYFI